MKRGNSSNCRLERTYCLTQLSGGYILFITQKNNYMFRRLIMAIFRLYTKHLVSSYTKHVYRLLIWGREGVKWARNLASALRIDGVGCIEGPCCYQAMSKLIIDKSMVGIILCLSVLRNCITAY